MVQLFRNRKPKERKKGSVLKIEIFKGYYKNNQYIIVLFFIIYLYKKMTILKTNKKVCNRTNEPKRQRKKLNNNKIKSVLFSYKTVLFVLLAVL